MNNSNLKKLNFNKLLFYPKKFKVQNEYSKPIDCKGFCIDCEKKKIFNLSKTKLTSLSHGCSTEDYISILGEMQSKKEHNGNVMFILEQPGGEYGLGKNFDFEGFTKYPPVYHYYWTPSTKKWIKSIGKLIKEDNFYGNYFAYIINKFGFSNCYITNAIKCKIVSTKENPKVYNAVAENCRNNFLQLEFDFFKPTLVCCFGGKSYFLTKNLKGIEKVQICDIYHPHAIATSMRSKKTKKEMLRENNKEIKDKMKKLSLSGK
jgi:hypothetical protein